MGIVSRDEARSLAAEQNLIPRDWTLIEEEAIATDIEQARVARWRDVARANSRVQLAARTFSQEPIVVYRYPTNTTITLYESGLSLLRPQLWLVDRAIKPGKTKQRAVLYEHPSGFTITDADVTAMLAQTEDWVDEGLVSEDLPEVLTAETVEE